MAPRRRSKAWRNRQFDRTIALIATWLVVGQHVMLFTVFTLDPYRPAVISVPELWAANRKWQFYLLIAVVVGSALMSIAAWRLRAPVRLTLIVSWLLFGLVMLGLHRERIEVMINLMIRHG